MFCFIDIIFLISDLAEMQHWIALVVVVVAIGEINAVKSWTSFGIMRTLHHSENRLIQLNIQVNKYVDFSLHTEWTNEKKFHKWILMHFNNEKKLLKFQITCKLSTLQWIYEQSKRIYWAAITNQNRNFWRMFVSSSRIHDNTIPIHDQG